MKRIWFVSHYSMPPQYEMRIKTQMFAHYLNLMGYETKIFSASTIHGTDINLMDGDERYTCRDYDDLHFIHIYCHNYSGNGIKRIRNMQEFAYKFQYAARNFEVPDVVVADVNCTNYAPIMMFCKRHGIRFFVDMRDLWPMSIVEYLHISEKNPVITYLYRREKNLYQKADGVIFSIEGGKQYIIDKGWDIGSGGKINLKKIHHINNGVNIEQFDHSVLEQAFQDPDLDDSNSFKVVYSGSIRKANSLDLLVECAALLSEQNIRFLIYGEGEEKAVLEAFCKKNSISNMIFKGKVEKQKIPYILSKCNLSILNYQQANTWKYGGSQNKLFEYFAAGRPVLSNIEIGYCLIKRYNCGISRELQNPEDYKKAIMDIMSLSQTEYNLLCRNARKAAEAYDYMRLSEELELIIKENSGYT